MATSPPLLPAAPPTLGAGDDQAKTEYFAALQKTLDALDARANAGPNWFEVAGAMLDPGRSGSFGEAIGRTATVMGRQQREQQDMQLPMAQVRAQLAGQKYEVQNQAKAIGLLSQAIGMPPAQVEQGLASGSLPQSAFSRITPGLYASIATLSPKVGEVVKNIFGMDKDLRTMATDDYKAGMPQAEGVAKYGARFMSLIPGGGRPAVQPAPLAPPITPPSTSPGPLAVAPAPLAATATPVQPGTDLSDMPLATQAEMQKLRQIELDKTFAKQRDSILEYSPQALSKTNRELRELFDIANTKPHLFGILQRQGVLAAFGAGAQEGITLGQFGSLSLPVKTMVEKYSLTKADQTDLSIAQKILANQFFENARLNKATLGPQISNSDVLLLKAPMATDADSGAAIKYWSKQQILGNSMKADLFAAQMAHDQQYGASMSPARFFSSPTYMTIFPRYEGLFGQLTKDHSPAYSTSPR